MIEFFVLKKSYTLNINKWHVWVSQIIIKMQISLSLQSFSIENKSLNSIQLEIQFR